MVYQFSSQTFYSFSKNQNDKNFQKSGENSKCLELNKEIDIQLEMAKLTDDTSAVSNQCCVGEVKLGDRIYLIGVEGYLSTESNSLCSRCVNRIR